MPDFSLSPFDRIDEDRLGETAAFGPGQSAESRYGRQQHSLTSIGLAIALHVGVAGLLSLTFDVTPRTAPASAPLQVNTFDLPGLPPAGDPKGDSPPPPNTADKRPLQDKPAEVAQAEAEPKTMAPSELPSPQSNQQAAAASTIENVDTGTGTLALGAKVHGDAAGLDPGLVAAVGQAVATRIRACWVPPAGKAPETSVSTIIVRYQADGSLDGEPRIVRVVNEIETPVAGDLNPWEQAVTAALKRCAPIGLPPAIYAYWREVDVQLFAGPNA